MFLSDNSNSESENESITNIDDFENAPANIKRKYVSWTKEKIDAAKRILEHGDKVKDITNATNVSERSARNFISKFNATHQFSIKKKRKRKDSHNLTVQLETILGDDSS